MLCRFLNIPSKTPLPKSGSGVRMDILFLCLLCLALGFPCVDTHGAGGVTGDVDNCTTHIQNAVDTGNQGDTFHGQAHALQHHGQHDHAAAGHTGGADGGQRGSEDDGSRELG